MNEIKRILFVDDECENFQEEFEDTFTQKGIEIVFCKSKEEGLKALNSKKHYDLILLDWFLEVPDDNIMSASFLIELKNKIFVPVFIWTHHYEDYEQEKLHGKIPYPKDLVLGISKEEFDSETIQEKIFELYKTVHIAHLSEIYRNTIHQKLEEVFFELSEVSGINLIRIIKSIVGETNNIDLSNDLIINFIHRRLISDLNFHENIKDLISNSISISQTTEEKIRQEIISKILYYAPSPNRIRCGDIITINDSDGNTKVAIIVSPDCDLSNAKTKHVQLIELREIDDVEMGLDKSNLSKIKQLNHPSFYFFPSLLLNSEHKDFVAILKSKIVLTEKLDGKSPNYPSSSKLLDYSDYFALGATLAEIKFICRIDEPYKSDFLNHLHSHDLRVGTPDIKKLWLS